MEHSFGHRLVLVRLLEAGPQLFRLYRPRLGTRRSQRVASKTASPVGC